MLKNIITVSLISATLMAGCSGPGNTTSGADTVASGSMTEKQAVSLLEQRQAKWTNTFISAQPTLASMLGLTQVQADGAYAHRLPDYSPAGMASFQQDMRRAVASLKEIDARALPDDKQQHLKILINLFQYYAGDNNFPGGYIDTWAGHLPYIINQISGPLIDVPKIMQVQQSVKSNADAEAYLSRLEKMDDFVNGVVAKFRQDMAQGIILPKKLHPKTLQFLNNFLASAPADHELVTTFESKLAQIDTMSDEDRADYTEKAAALVESVVYPAYKRALSAVNESEQQASNDDGIWSQPNGEAFYQHAIRFLGDSTLSADAIHQLGLSEVDRISAQMDSILREQGYAEGTVGERMMQLAKLPGQVYPATDAGRADLLGYLNEEIEGVMAKAPEFYGTLPEQAVEVRRIPPVSEAGEAGGFYSPPSLDGSRPGIYWINLRDMKAVPKFGLKTLTYHEAVPGHHFQIALNMAQQDIGLLRQNAPYNAYVEGWALYSEFVASERMGMYEDDPLGNLGRLQAELYRAVRLVVDTGLHFKHWTREQAIDYFHKTTGTSLSDVVPEVERYMAWPGQALGYKLGMLEFVSLEKETREALKEKFDIREFHDLILLPGARPISMVKADVQEWIAEKQR